MAATEHLDTSTGRINPLAVVSLTAGIVALAGMLGLGTGTAAAFAVGAGHVSLQQIRHRQDRGQVMALAGLFLGYGIAAWGLIIGIQYVPSLVAFAQALDMHI